MAAVDQLIKLFGAELLTKDGTMSTAEALSGATGIAIYFSAHWCPPCRGFTPQFAEKWTKTYKDKGMKVVFVSSDRDQTSFDEYYKEMPWFALPYENRDAKNTLSKKFKVNGIPSLVMLDASGNLITDKARGKLDEPDTYPWIPPTFADVMKDANIISKDGPVNVSELQGKPLGIYFSAHWCPPCRGWTPKLAEWYTEGLKDKMEIVFVSSDRDQKAFDEYFAEMPWKALSFDQRDKKSALSDMFGVEGIPTFVVLDGAGNVVTTDGRSKVTKDPTGANFPEAWLPQPINDCNDDPSDLNSEVCFLVLNPSSSSTEAITSIAKKHQASAGSITDMKYRFFTAPEGDIVSKIRSLIKCQDNDVLVLMDLSSGGKYKVLKGDISEEFIESQIAAHEAGSISMDTLER